MDLMEIACENPGSGSCAVVGYGISGAEPLCSATRELVN